MRDLIENLIQDTWELIKFLRLREWSVIVVIIFFVYVMIFGQSTNSYSDHMRECIADGHKGYECRGILKGGNNGR